ncbi:Glucosamine-1-phosphate N-acetyltransferase [Actinidia chinensis var. chinensis]|uniref:Glucosamine-1-phosphate N-acetyltransferase n=1 Tax=Actinidia chinensis var. chinensis TaxID=1590841 RepID=A0A2R6PID4_ACTCC|nr:Glucosamine-1-phosphate N-acetyltransferase [Actinidia chinensis var. chinensis]
MRFLKRIAGLLGFVKDEGHEVRDEDDVDVDEDVNRPETHLPRKGFSVPVQVPVERSLGPVLVPCAVGDGGVQGLKWYARSLKIDDDGDVADEFFDEILPIQSSGKEDEHQHQPFPRLQVKCNARPAKVRNQTLIRDGKVLQRVEHQGRLQWV